jgi:hypothetical protein
MQYTIIEVKQEHPNACGDLTETEKIEILSDLNSENFSERIQMSYIHTYKDPQDLHMYEHCHSTAIKYARENPELEVVSGYIVIPISYGVNLLSHSVVRDVSTGILWELMYSVESKKFIVRSPNIRGYDLTAY